MSYTPGLNGGRANFAIGGNSTSAGAGYSTITSGTINLMGGNNITLSQNGQSVTISGGAGGGGVMLSGSNNSITSGTASFVNANGVSWSFNGQSISASISQGGVANAAGTQTATSGTVNFANSNGISFGMSGSNQITASYTVPTQTNQTLSYAATGNTTGNTSGLSFDARSITYQGLGAVSVGMSTSAGGSLILFSSPTQTVQTQNLMTVNGTQGAVSISGGNNITVGNNASTITISAPNQSVQTQNMVALSGSNNSITSGTASFVNANGVSWSFNGQSISGSVNTSYLGSNASTNYVQAGAGFNGTNASGTIASNAISVSIAPNLNVGVTSGGNSAGATGTVSNQMVLFAGNNVTLSQTTGAGGATVSMIAPNFATAAQVTTIQQYLHNSDAFYSSSTFGMINASASIARMIIPAGLSFSRVDIPLSISGATSATTNTAAMAISAVGVIYSRNGATLNPIVGQSSTTTYSYASNTGVYSSVTGPRVMSFNLATSLSAGEYYMGLQFSSNTSSVGLSTTNLGWTVAPIVGTTYSVAPFADMSAATAASVNPISPLQGVNSVTISNTTMTMQQSQITNSGTQGVRGNFVVMFRNA